jgi:hypothetical protein
MMEWNTKLKEESEEVETYLTSDDQFPQKLMGTIQAFIFT